MNRTDRVDRVGFTGADGELRVTDRIENETLVVGVDGTPAPEPALTDVFPFPVDGAVSVETSSLTFENVASLRLRDEHGDMVATLIDPATFPRDTYCLEVSGTMKLYVRVRDAAMDAEGISGPEPARITFDESTVVTVGARSRHTRPEATITVPDDPESLMAAVSVLGSSIKEFSAERSWPTLRGYPPRFERGDELRVPDRLSVPETGVRITVPATYADVYRVAPLAFYLGARVEPGDPALHLDGGYVERLPTEGAELERRVETLVGQFLLLDSLVRMEGYAPSERREYGALAPQLPFYPPTLYDRSIPEQLLEYLEIDAAKTAPYVPTPPVRAQLRPDPADIELLPHLVHGLAAIRVACPSSPRTPTRDAMPGEETVGGVLGVPAGIHAVTGGGSDVVTDLSTAPNRTALLTPATYENRLARSLPTEGEAVVHVLVDDDERARATRRAVATVDAASDPTVTVVSEPTVADVEASLSDPGVDACHVALPVQDGRIRCGDGLFDPSGIELVGPALVTLGARTDAALGGTLVDAGALLATFLDEPTEPDTLRAFTRLLGAGVTVAESLQLSGIAQSTRVRHVGDPTHRIASPKRGIKAILSYSPTESGEFTATMWMSPAVDTQLGMEIGQLLDSDGTVMSLVGGVANEQRGTSTAVEVSDSIGEADVVTLIGNTPILDDELSPAEIERLAEREPDVEDSPVRRLR
ncbi:hypothetical protein JCM17823_01110 [Halorubrum gandharaense]